MATVMRTICIVGFPPEAHPRELKNLCRFMTGFEGAHVAFAGPGQCSSLFVKFASPEIARSAMDMLQGVPFDMDSPQQVTLKVEYARREMEVRPNSMLPVQHAPHPMMEPPRMAMAPVQRSLPPIAMEGGHMKRLGLTGGELTTITVLGLKDKGLLPEELVAWFNARAGYVTHHVNERIDALFIKYGSGSAAERAMQEANGQNFGCEWARRNLDDDIGAQRQHAPPPMAYPPAQMHPPMGQIVHPPPNVGYAGPPAKRQRSNLGELSTLAILGFKEKELTADMMNQWFSAKPGFVAMQVNERINGVFAKFSTQAEAQQVLEEANSIGWGAEWARRNLDL